MRVAGLETVVELRKKELIIADMRRIPSKVLQEVSYAPRNGYRDAASVAGRQGGPGSR